MLRLAITTPRRHRVYSDLINDPQDQMTVHGILGHTVELPVTVSFVHEQASGNVPTGASTIPDVTLETTIGQSATGLFDVPFSPNPPGRWRWTAVDDAGAICEGFFYVLAPGVDPYGEPAFAITNAVGVGDAQLGCGTGTLLECPGNAP